MKKLLSLAAVVTLFATSAQAQNQDVFALTDADDNGKITEQEFYNRLLVENFPAGTKFEDLSTPVQNIFTQKWNNLLIYIETPSPEEAEAAEAVRDNDPETLNEAEFNLAVQELNEDMQV
jgi:hypothetical protein